VPTPPVGLKSAKTRQAPGVRASRVDQVPSGDSVGWTCWKAGEVASYGDQVQALLVVDVVRRDRRAVRPLDGERDRDPPAGVGRGAQEPERVAALGDRQPAGSLGRLGIVAGAVALVGRVGGRLRLAERSDGTADPGRGGEHRDQDQAEAEEPDGSAHASW
jgi:hypothetical protein